MMTRHKAVVTFTARCRTLNMAALRLSVDTPFPKWISGQPISALRSQQFAGQVLDAAPILITNTPLPVCTAIDTPHLSTTRGAGVVAYAHRPRQHLKTALQISSVFVILFWSFSHTARSLLLRRQLQLCRTRLADEGDKCKFNFGLFWSRFRENALSSCTSTSPHCHTGAVHPAPTP